MNPLLVAAGEGLYPALRPADDVKVLDALGSPAAGGAPVDEKGTPALRQGKVFDIELEGGDPAQAEALLKQAADKLLANTVIENYKVDVLG